MGACLSTETDEYIPVESGYHFTHQCDDKSIERCDYLQSMLAMLTQYNNETNLDIDISILIEIINNYIHLINKHDRDEDFEFIVNQMGCCDITKCVAFTRNNRDRSNHRHHKFNIDASTQIFDKIHCYFSHCYDIGNRFSMKQKTMIKDMYNDDEEKDEKKQDFVDKYLVNSKI
eukprot:4851_1